MVTLKCNWRSAYRAIFIIDNSHKCISLFIYQLNNDNSVPKPKKLYEVPNFVTFIYFTFFEEVVCDCDKNIDRDRNIDKYINIDRRGTKDCAEK